MKQLKIELERTEENGRKAYLNGEEVTYEIGKEIFNEMSEKDISGKVEFKGETYIITEIEYSSEINIAIGQKERSYWDKVTISF